MKLPHNRASTRATLQRMHSTADVCAASGLSYRQVDHWLTIGVLEAIDVPNPGSGQGRRLTAGELTIACVLAAMRELNVPLGVLRRVAEQLRLFADSSWSGLLFIDADGWIQRTPHTTHAGWIIDLDRFANAYA